MKHLKLKQNSNTEIVTSAIIEKLYQLVSNNTLDSSSSLSGNLQSPNAYEDAVNYLTNKFSDLSINITNGSYIRFADSNTEQICATNWGDGTGITTTQASAITTLNNKFQGNTSITSFNELAKFTNVKDTGSFNNCTALKSIDLSNITILNSFKNCTSLTSLGNLNNITTVNIDSLDGCILMKELGNMPMLFILGDAAFKHSGLVTIGDMPNVQKIPSQCFQNSSNLETIGDLSGVTSISTEAFGGCTKLKSIQLSSNCTVILSDFSNCINLTSLGDLSGVISLASTCFYNCTSLVSTNLNNLQVINDSTFSKCTSLTDAGTTNKLTTIGNWAFYSCTKLPTIDLSNVTSIGNYAFSNCLLLDNLTFNDNLTMIGYKAFDNTTWYNKQSTGIIKLGKVLYTCKGALADKNITISEDVVYITQECFSGQSNIETISLNNNVTTLNKNVFSNCTNLKSISLDNITILQDVDQSEIFLNCTSLTSVVLNNSITLLPPACFKSCTSLTTINLDNIQILKDTCFYKCPSLTKITLSKVTNINDSVFAYCTGLQYVKITATTIPTIHPLAFNFTTCNIYVPDTLVDSYKVATNWSSLASRIFSLTQFAIDFPNG